MTMGDRRRKDLYLETHIISELEHHAERLERTTSWIVQTCVRMHLRDLRAMPDAPGRETERYAVSERTLRRVAEAAE